MRRTTPNMSASPAATMAYSAPRVRPWIASSSRSSTRALRLDRDRFHEVELAALDLDDEHVDEGLVGLVELDPPHRRIGDVDLLQRVADRLSIGAARLLDGLLDGGGHGVAEGDGGEAAVDADGDLPALEPPLVPLGVEGGRPVGGLDEAVGDRRGVLHLEEKLLRGHAAAGEELLRQPELA